MTITRPLRRSLLIAALVVAAAACGTPEVVRSGTGVGAGTDHPTGADELVLRVEETGGFVPQTYLFTNIAGFSLLGDGRVVTQGPQIEIFPPPALPSLNEVTITEQGIQRVLDEAEKAGLFGPDHHYDYNGVADASTTVFTLVAEGKRHRISAYALGLGGENQREGEPSAPPGVEGPGSQLSSEDREARAKLQAFRAKLGDLRSWLPTGSVGEEKTYEFDRMRVFVVGYRAGSEPQDPEPQRKAWPLSQDPASFGDPVDNAENTRCGVLQGGDLDTMLKAAQRANTQTIWTFENREYNAYFRPMLPDESGCLEKI
jgi:hypothetical protein